jgi:hypothetical protein
VNGGSRRPPGDAWVGGAPANRRGSNVVNLVLILLVVATVAAVLFLL